MKFINSIAGFIVVIFGVLIGYVDFLIVNTFYSVSLWIADILKAPEALAMFITLILVLSFIGIILMIALVALYIVAIGFGLILSD